MYGLISKALTDMIRKEHGDEVWAAIRTRAGVAQDTFVSMDMYADEVTYALVGAASEILETPADELLRAFGHFWTQFTMTEGYAGLIKSTGSSLPAFLRRLDDMHGRLQLSFPKARPPSFAVESEAPGEMRIVYRSEREGLAPFVFGLLEGLGPVFDTTVEVTHAHERTGPADPDVFLIRYGA